MTTDKPTLPIDAVLPAVGRTATRAEASRVLWAMTPTERVTAMRTGRLSLQQCAEWAARRPHEVPLVNGEFAYIAMYDAELD